MNKYIFALVLGSLFISCQNTPKNAAESATPPPLPEAPAPASAESMQQSLSGITANITQLEVLRKQADELPYVVKKAKQAELDGIYADLEGMIEKQTGMLNDLKAVTGAGKTDANATEDSGAASSLNTAQVQDFNESAARYSKEAERIKEALGKMTASEKKN